MPGLRFLTVNIGNPSTVRARRQLDWLADRSEEVFVLTETKASAGCLFLKSELGRAGYTVLETTPPPGKYGALIASRLPLRGDRWAQGLFMEERVASGLLSLPSGPLRVAGVYVPSRDASPQKIERKRQFLMSMADRLPWCVDVPTVLLGDFNVLEPDHLPRYGFFKPFEYDFYRMVSSHLEDAYRLRCPHGTDHSWVGRTGDGYRYDHAFVSRGLASTVVNCAYIHETRERADRLTDHSAMILELDISLPAAISSARKEIPLQPSLF